MVLDARSMGGVETHTLTLSEELLLRGHDVIVISSNKSLEDKFSKLGIKHHTLPIFLTLERKTIKKLPKFLFSIFWLINIAKSEKVDIIHSHAPASSAYLSYIVSKILKKPLIYTIHGVLHVRFFWKFFKYFGSKCSDIVAISGEIREYLCSNLKIDEKKIHVIYNGINLNMYALKDEPNPPKNDIKKIICITRLDREKVRATFKIINSMDEIIKKFSNVQLVIVGNGEKFKEAIETTKEINTKFEKKIIKMVGEVEPERVPFHLQSSDIVIGAGRVAIEGMACGKPVVFVSSGGFGGTLTEKNLGKIKYYNFSGRGCKSNYDSIDIARTILQLLVDPIFYYNSKKLSTKVANDLDIKKAAKQIEMVYLNSIETS
jgi:glycosyltransferase involved in cell wall biosynthesis